MAIPLCKGLLLGQVAVTKTIHMDLSQNRSSWLAQDGILSPREVGLLLGLWKMCISHSEGHTGIFVWERCVGDGTLLQRKCSHYWWRENNQLPEPSIQRKSLSSPMLDTTCMQTSLNLLSVLHFQWNEKWGKETFSSVLALSMPIKKTSIVIVIRLDK